MTEREIKIVIASPSDVITERDWLLHRLETKFRRDHYEELCKARIIVEGWESLAPQPGPPQNIINHKLIQNSDIVLAIFRHRLGTPIIDPVTGQEQAPSGTAEELLQAISGAKKPIGMAYFFKSVPDLSLPEIAKEWEKLSEFKKEISKKMIYRIYDHEERILELVCRDICENIREHELFIVA